MIIKEPKKLDSFSRCETDYRLLEFSNGRFAIEWHGWSDGIPAYAIMYDDIHKVVDDFNGLRMKKLSYRQIEERTAREDILDSCPWKEEGKELVRIEKDYNTDKCWNVIMGNSDLYTKVGPYASLGEAAAHLEEDLIEIGFKEEG
jgi:hypothetical protein